MLCGKAVIEIKPRAFNKGTAVRELMQIPPFAASHPAVRRRRRHRRVGVRDAARARRLRLFGRSRGGRRPRRVRRSAGRPRLARRPRRRTWLSQACTISGSILRSSAMGARPRWSIHCRGSCGGAFRASTAIRSSRGCWPATRRRVSARSCSTAWSSIRPQYVRNTAIVSTILTDDKGASVRITDFAPRFREYDRIFRPPQLMRIIEPVSGLAAHHHPGASDLRLRRADDGEVDRQQSCDLSRHRCRRAAHHRRCAVLHRPRSAFRADAAASSRHRPGRAVRRPTSLQRAARSPSARRITGPNGCGGFRSHMNGRTRSSVPRSRSSSAISRRPAASSRLTRLRFRRRWDRGATGTIATAGCATPISW